MTSNPVHYWIFWRLRLLIWGQLTGPSLNSLLNQNHNNPWDNGGHSLKITRQLPTKASSVLGIWSWKYLCPTERSIVASCKTWTPNVIKHCSYYQYSKLNFFNEAILKSLLYLKFYLIYSLSELFPWAWFYLLFDQEIFRKSFFEQICRKNEGRNLTPTTFLSC